jgi:hypothetical protein
VKTSINALNDVQRRSGSAKRAVWTAQPVYFLCDVNENCRREHFAQGIVGKAVTTGFMNGKKHLGILPAAYMHEASCVGAKLGRRYYVNTEGRYSDGMDGLGSTPGRNKRFLCSAATRPAMGPTQPPIRWAKASPVSGREGL